MFTQIEARGPDALSFLQAQLTQDVARVSPACSPLAAWCDPRGRVVVVLRLLHLPDGAGLVVPTTEAGDILQQLARYRLRARLELRCSDAGWQGLAVAAGAAAGELGAAGLLPGNDRDASCQRDGVTAVRLAPQGDIVELYGAAPPAAGHALQAPHWRAARIRAGIADIVADTRGRYTPHMLNLDRLGAVNFDKGCYTGQEIVARTQYRGSVKRRIRHCRSAAALAVGATLRADGADVGQVVAAAGTDLLALLPAAAPYAELTSGTIAVAPGPPS